MSKQQPSLDELFPKKPAAPNTDNGLDINSLFPKKKDDTDLSGQINSMAGSSEQGGNPRQIFDMSYADWGKKYGAIGEFAADIADVPIYFKNKIYSGLLEGAINDEYRRADAKKEKPDFDKIANLRKDINKVSLSRAALDKFEESDDFVTKAVKNVAGTVIGSLASSAGAYKSGSIGAGTGALMGAGIGNVFAEVTAPMGAFIGYQAFSSYANEYGGAITQAMIEKGYDISDKTQLEKAFADTELMDAARQKGIERGLTVASIDVITGGLASKFGGASAVKSIGKKLLPVGQEFTEAATKRIAAATTTLIEGTGGSIGEASAQLVSEGKVSDWDSVGMEFFAEVGSGAPTIGYNYYKAAQINHTANKENSKKIQSLQIMIDTLPEGDTSIPIIESKISALKEQNENRNNTIVDTLDSAPVPATKRVLELTNQIETFEQKLEEFNSNEDSISGFTDEQREQQRSFQDIYNELTSERDSIVSELAEAKKLEANITAPSAEITTPSPFEVTKIQKAIDSMTEFVGKNLKAIVPVFNVDAEGNYSVTVGKENKPNADSKVVFTPEEKKQRRELDAMLDEQKLTQEEYNTNVTELNKQVITRGIEEKTQQIAAKPQPETATTDGAQAATAPQTEEFVYETKPEERKQWKEDFEIVDNRNGEIAPAEGEAPSRWIVKNTVTGKTVGAPTKTEASNVAKNPNEHNFGQGETYTRPIPEQPTETVNPDIEASLSNVENTTKALEGLDVTELANRIPDAPTSPDTTPTPDDAVNEVPVTSDNTAQPSSGYDKTNPKSVAEAYHQAKKDGTNPELVSAVESLLGKEPLAQQPTAEQSTGEGYTMDTLFDNPADMISDLEDKLSSENTAKQMGFVLKGYRTISEAIADNIITRSLSKAIGTGFVGIRKIGELSFVTIATKDKDGNIKNNEVSINNIWKGTIGYTEKAIKGLSVKALNSNNVAAKEVQNAVSSIIGNLTSTQEFQEARREFAGSKNNANNLLFKIGESLNKMIGNDKKALYRVHSLLDPEAFSGEPKEGRPSSVEDLSFSELRLFNFLRGTNDFIHEWHYRNGFLDENTYQKNKGKYFARAYREIEENQYADIYEAINKAGAGAEFNMFRKRKEFSEIENLTLSDPIYITMKRMGAMIHNKAVFDFAQKVSNDDNYKTYSKLSDVPQKNKQYYKKLNGNGNPKRFGDLTNKYVPIEIYEQLYGTQFVSQFVTGLNDFATKYDNMFLRQLTKKLKTVGSPLTRAANVISGFSFAFMGGVDPITLMTNKPDARRSLESYDSYAQELTKAGLLGGQLTGMDIKKSGANSQGISIIKSIPIVGEKTAKTYEYVEKLASDTYSKVDDITKIAYYRSLIENYGYSKEAALKMTAEQMQNYATVGKAFKLASKLPVIGNSFIKFKPDSIRILYNSFKNRPIYGMMFVGALAGLSKTFSKLSGETEEEREIRENRPFTTKLDVGGLNVSFGWKIGDTEFNVGRYISPYTMYDRGYKGNSVSEMSEYAPLQVQYLGKNKGLGGYMPKLSDPLLGPVIQSLFNVDNNGLDIHDPRAGRNITQTVSTQQKWFNGVKYVLRSWGTPYAAYIENIFSAFGEKENYKGEIQNPFNALLSIAIKNEKIDPDILSEKYSRYLSSMDREVGEIISNWKSKYKRSAEDIDRINNLYETGKIKNVDNKNTQIKEIEDGYSNLAMDLQEQMMTIVSQAKEPVELISKLQKLKVYSEKKTGATSRASDDTEISPLTKSIIEASNKAIESSKNNSSELINKASDIVSKALSSLGKTTAESASAVNEVKNIISSTVTKGSVDAVGLAYDVVNKISSATSEASDKIDNFIYDVKEKGSSVKSTLIQNTKLVANNPDLVMAAYQRYKDKNDEGGATSNKIILPKNIDVDKSPEFSLTGGLPYVGSDTTNLGNMRKSSSDYLSVSSIIDLNKVNMNYRNRGEYKEGQGNIQANFLVPFEKPTNLNNDKMYVGIKDGKIVTGRANEVKDADAVSPTPFAQVINITGKYEQRPNDTYKFPLLETIDKNQEPRLNISASKDGKENVNNKFAGGAVILETPDRSQKYIVRGSLKQVRNAFVELKQNTNSKYLNMYILDNGSFSTGLNTKDGKSSTEELKAYEAKARSNSGGSGIYLK